MEEGEKKEGSYQITIVLDETTYRMLEQMCVATGRARSRICNRYIQHGLVADAQELAEFKEKMAKFLNL